MISQKEDKYFYCYNKDLATYLYNRGIKYIHKAKEIRTGNIFSCYKITNELSLALKQYKELN